MFTRLVLTLTMLAPPSEEVADATFNAGKYSEALEMYLERAAAPGLHPPDALHGAHASLIALRGETGDATYLCRALDIARGLLARDAFADADERASWAEIEAKDIDTIKASGAICSNATAKTPSAGEESDADKGKTPRSVTPEGPIPAPAVQDSAALHRPRGRVIAGASLIAVGAGLAGGIIAGLVGRQDANAKMMSLGEQAMAEDRDLTASERTALAAQDRRYVRLTQLATGAGIALGVSLITGLALLVAPTHRRLARVGVRPGGILYSF